MMELLSGILETVPIWLVWSVVVGMLVYWYLTKNYNYWKNEGVPYVSAVPIFGSMLQIFVKTMHEVEMERYKEKGRIFGSYEGRIPVLVVGDPDVLRDIMVKQFQFFTGRRRLDSGVPLVDNMVISMQGEPWKRVRTVLTPAFSTGKIKRMISIFKDSANTLTCNLKDAAKKREPIDAKRLFGAFTIDVIASTAFATRIDSLSNPDNPFVAHAKTVFVSQIPWRIGLFLMLPAIVRFFRISIFAPRPIKFFEKVILEIIEERKKTKQKRNDFLQLMLDAVEREGEKETTEDVKEENEEIKEMGHEEENDQIFKSYQSNKSLSNVELVANSIIFFLAGFETTASTLTFAAYELAVNEDIQDKVIEEIDAAIKEKGELNYEALCEMQYLDNIISETLRKYPISVRAERIADEDYEVKTDSMEIKVPKGMLIGIPIYSIHHDPDYYPDPEKFNPERFSTDEKSKRHPYTYIPFGAGPRNCIGMRFALMEMKTCLATILSQCRFKVCSTTQIPLQFSRKSPGMLHPKQVSLMVETRKS